MTFNLYFTSLKPEVQAEIHTDIWTKIEQNPAEMAEIKKEAEGNNLSINNILAEKVSDVINRCFSLQADLAFN